MKYIDKATPDSVAAASALHAWRDTYRYEFRPEKPYFPQYSGLELRELCKKSEIKGSYMFGIIPSVEKNNLREALRNEQNGLCCYCCQKLDKDKDESRKRKDEEELDFEPVEHFLDKGTHPCETFNYENLLLACRGNKQPKKHTFARNDSYEMIAKQFNVSPDELKKENPTLSFIHLEEVKIKLPQHCDVAKEDKPILINPADSNQSDCWKRFTYNRDGEILPAKNDADAKETIKILKLNITALKEGRKVAWQAAKESYDETNLIELLVNEDFIKFKEEFQRLKDSVSTAPFSPVYWCFFENPS